MASQKHPGRRSRASTKSAPVNNKQQKAVKTSRHRVPPQATEFEGQAQANSAGDFSASPFPINVQQPTNLPEILAPAGDMQSALAAYAAGADAVYLGLKHFSARMQAENFSTKEVARLADFAHSMGKRVYVAMNTLLKSNDPPHAMRLIRRLALDVKPDALIIQDAGLIPLAHAAEFKGEIHLSTLANVTHQHALQSALQAGAQRVILPRELSINEVALMSAACPKGMTLELFVHGALCYCVSGRCWWSSYMGGKSGLRGRCVQPCRRVYTQKNRKGRFFSCLDLSLEQLVRHLLPLENLTSWKIEGRRKGPHYVYHVTKAYHLLRQEGADPLARQEAEKLLAFSLGRPGTKSLFLSGKAAALAPLNTPGASDERAVPFKSKDGQTNSGLMCGVIGNAGEGGFTLRPRFALLPQDYLRVGYEDEPWHTTVSVGKTVAEGQAYSLRMPRGKYPKPGTPVFLIDRKEPALTSLLKEWEQRLNRHTPVLRSREEDIMALYPPVYRQAGASKNPLGRAKEISLYSHLPQGKEAKEALRLNGMQGLWLSPKALRTVSRTIFSRISWWLPPVIWPDEDAAYSRLVADAIRQGARQFVCNAPWQQSLFPHTHQLCLIAGPFCNIANAPALALLKHLGFQAAVVSPELPGEDLLSLPGQSPIPLGVVLEGYWPMGIARHKVEPVSLQEGFQSPKGETFWAKRYGQNTWIYPSWPLDVTQFAPKLFKAGYTFGVRIRENPPKELSQIKRTSPFNWEIPLL